MTTASERSSKKRVSITGRAAIYIRASSDKQAENGASLDVQSKACRRYCDDHGLDVVGEFKDVESGLHNGRVQYQQALALAKSKGIDKLVVWRLDRLGRDAAEYLTQLKALKKAGVDVVSVTQPSESALMQSLLGVLAEEESRQISVRTMASKQRRFEEGYWLSPAPLGYQLSKAEGGGTYLVAHPAEAPIVKQLFERYANGRHSLSDLRDYLNEQGIVMSRYAVWYILKSRVYLGEVMHGRFSKSPFAPKPEISYYKGRHPALVDAETFERVQTRLSANKSRHCGGTAPRFLFTGLIGCSSCGRSYVGVRKQTKSGPKLQYRCGRKHSHGDCRGSTVRETVVRAAVLLPIQAVISALSDSALREAVREELAREQEAAALATRTSQAGLMAQIEKLEARLSKLEDGWMDGIVSRARYVERRDQIEAELKDIRRQLEATPAPVQADASKVLAMAEKLTVDDLDDGAWRGLVEELVEKILVHGKSQGRRAYVEVVWKPAFQAVKAVAEAMARE